MDIKKILPIIIIAVVAIIAIVGIVLMGGKGEEQQKIGTYIGKTNTEFENEFIENYKTLRKFVREKKVEKVSKNYESFDMLETFNENYFSTNKLAAISIYEDNASVYEYHIDDIEYNEDRTVATINYTNKVSGYEGTLSSSWINCLIVELEGTVTSVNFNEIKE